MISGDSWFQIAQEASVSLNGLLQANNAKTTTVLRPGGQLCLPDGAPAANTARACVSKRTVSAGDSWNAISRATGVPTDALIGANKATQSSFIFPGQSLCLPEAGFGGQLPSVPLRAAPVPAVRAASPTRGTRHAAAAGSTSAWT